MEGARQSLNGPRLVTPRIQCAGTHTITGRGGLREQESSTGPMLSRTIDVSCLEPDGKLEGSLVAGGKAAFLRPAVLMTFISDYDNASSSGDASCNEGSAVYPSDALT